MKRIALLPVLLLLLVSLQAYAGVCSVRCGVMALAVSRNSMPAMANCRDDISSGAAVGAGAMLIAPRRCSGTVCQSDLQLLQNRTSPDVEGRFLPVAVVTPADFPIIRLLKEHISRRFGVERSTQSIHPFDPVISSLRI